MAYKVLTDFIDLKDGKYFYRAGDAYPRKGYKASAARVKELAGNSNRMGYALIVEVKANRSQKKVSEDVQSN